MFRSTNTARAAACLALLSAVAATNTGIAREPALRAELGDQLASTGVGANFNETIAPFASKAMHDCAKQGMPSPPGVAITILADVAQDGTWSAVTREPASVSADCVYKQLLALELPPPEGWDWKHGAFPLTLRLGVGVAEGE